MTGGWLRQFVSENLSIKLIALGVAILLWSYVGSRGLLERTVVVPVQLRGVPTHLAVVGEPLDFADVRVRGREALVRALSPEDLSITVNLAGASVGENVYFLDERGIGRPPRVDIIRINPRRLVVRLEPMVRKAVRVVPQLAGKPAAGFRVGKVDVNPGFVTVEGAHGALKNLEELSTDAVDVTAARGEVRREVQLSLMGREIRLVDRAPVTVMVTVGVTRGTGAGGNGQ